MLKSKFFIVLAIVCIFINSCNVKENSISITGAFALYPMATRWVEEYKKLHPEIRLDLSAGGAGKGMADVLAGMVDLAMVSREINKTERSAGAWNISVVKDAVVPTISENNPFLNDLKTKGLKKEHLQEIFLTEGIKTWGKFLGNNKNEKINVFTRSDACGAGEIWGKYLDKDQQSLKGIGVNQDPGIAEAVKTDILSIGYNNIGYVYDMKTRKKYPGLEIARIDFNNNGQIDEDENFYDSIDKLTEAIKQGKYPSPPSRNLYFVTKGKPLKKEILDFLNWILTDGQHFVSEAGYVQLSVDEINIELNKLR